MTEIMATRLSKSFSQIMAESASHNPSLLVRIYPVGAIEPPIELKDQPLLVGRDSQCSLTLSDDSVSRRHALIEPIKNGFLLSDLDSTNGTYVNEQRIEQSTCLIAGDRVRFGNQIFKFLSTDRIESEYHEVIFKMMTTDGLTSAHNKRYLLELLERELHQSRRADVPLCAMMLDLDHFKSINDTYGHLAGDAVLVEFARRAKAALRCGDLFARYGGEEFAAVLTRTSLDDALQIAERIRESICVIPVEFENHSIAVTVSIGVCYEARVQSDHPRDLLAKADVQLYAAKNGGRNQVRACESPAATN